MFLKSASFAAAASVFPAGVFAQSGVPTAKAVRWGIVGTGHRGRVAHIPAMQLFPGEMEIVAACDVMENHLQQAVAKIGGKVQGYTDYQNFLANPDVNAIAIATPNCRHKEMVLAALQAGKHVMCEKPMAISFDECKAMKAAADKSDRVVLYSMQLRYSTRWNAFRQAIEQGKIGRPLLATMLEFRGDWNRGDVWQYDDPRLGKVNWRFSHAASGGTLSEKVCHYFDILHWMMGENPKSIACEGGIAKYKDGRDTWDHATTTMTYANGCRATHTLCMFAPNRLDLQIIGEEGSLLVEREDSGIVLQSKGKRETITPPPEIAHGERGPAKGQETAVVLMYQDFLDCVKNRKKPRMDADKAMASCKTAWLGELSNETKKEVTWDAIS